MRILQITHGALPLLFAVLQGGPPAPAQDDSSVELVRARDEIRRAQESVTAAEKKIVAAYQEFEQFLASIKNAAVGPRVEGATRRVVDAIRADLVAGKLSSDPGQRARVTQEIRTRLQDELAAVFPESLRTPVASRLSVNLYNLTASQADPAEAIRKLTSDICNKWFDSPAPAHELWNRDLYKEVQAARDYADARTAHASATEKVARMEHPERFHPAYAGTPEGMILVPGGVFTLGPNDGYDIDTNKRKTTFQVTLKPFYMDKTEVSCKQYADFLKSISRSDARIRLPQSWTPAKDGKGGDFASMIPPGRENYAVTGISYEDAAAYAIWAKKRLPTEDEWEAAARGYKSLAYPWGSQYEPKRANDQNGDLGGVAAVGTHPGDESPFGALDMAGNVMEWTATLEGGKLASPKPDSNQSIVIRGGAYDREPKKCSGVYRWVYASSMKIANLGFRCVKDAF